MSNERLGYVVLTYGPMSGRPFAGFLLPTREEADRMAETASTRPGERHVVAEVIGLGEASSAAGWPP